MIHTLLLLWGLLLLLLIAVLAIHYDTGRSSAVKTAFTVAACLVAVVIGANLLGADEYVCGVNVCEVSP